MFLLAICLSCTDQKKLMIKHALDNQMKDYPLSRLQDIYKNFFQDYFGPGHLVGDTASSLEYLRRELREMEGSGQIHPVEVTGYMKQFVRIDLNMVRCGKIPTKVFEEAFINSASEFKLPDIEDWQKDWNEILSVVLKYYPDIPGIDEDQQMIIELLDAGDYVVHHSDIYEATYNPHYRLISQGIFEKMLKPFLDDTEQ